MSKILLLLLAALALGSAFPASAQTAANRLDHAFLVSGDPGIGVLWRHSDPMDWGVSVGARYDSRDGDALTSGFLAFVLKRYMDPDGRFGPYWHLRLGPRWDRYSDTYTRWGLGAELGLGLEWFAVERVSIGAHAGIGLSWLRFGQDHGDRDTMWSFVADTSPLRIAFWF